jgi:AraC-like DNA-binding protein
MDPLSDVLLLLKPQSYAAAGFDLGGDWSIQFPAHDGFKCYAIASGEGWVEVEGHAAELGTAGDCFLLPQGLPFRVASDLGLTPINAESFYADLPDGGINVYQGGGGTSGVVANFMLTGSHADLLVGMLPPIVHIKLEADKAALRWSIEQMMAELRNPQPGAALVLQQLATMLLIKAIRLHIADDLNDRVGWLFALADKRMSLAINGIHREPGAQWTLQSLAECAGMSRTAFAVKFKETVGETPIDYLTQWRMRLAGERLTNSSDSISVIAQSLGYESESAFSTAFKRVTGCSPRQYGRLSVSAAALNLAE